ncbi:hypothetical protein ISS22_04305 [candidate division KSB1 bacterium]|nr:hypothetical protein [candidate division KSB1 bacterium]
MKHKVCIRSINDGIIALTLSCFDSAQHEATLTLHPERSRRVKVNKQNKITLIY